MNHIKKITLLSLLLPVFLVGGGQAQYSFGQSSMKEGEREYIYEKTSIKNLSLLYWALGKLDINKDEDIDNFMLINECDIHRDYYSHEFNWREIRKSSKSFIEDNKKNFPLRFEFMQQLKVTDYDFEREGFDIAEDHKIYPTRRFEVLATDISDTVCARKNNIPRYPRGLVVEFSRPFSMIFVPVKSQVADEYISDKMEYFKALPEHQQTEQYMYSTRNVYLVMKVKFFASQGESRTPEGVDLANVLAVLEGYDIYGDPERNQLLYSESFRSRKKKSKMEQELIKQYQESKKKADSSAENSNRSKESASEVIKEISETKQNYSDE